MVAARRNPLAPGSTWLASGAGGPLPGRSIPPTDAYPMTTRTPALRRTPTPFETSADEGPAGSFGLRSDAFLFEVSWEVCNQIGGIYQVVRSKAPGMIERWRDRYCLLGPYVEGKAQLELEPAPPSGWLARVVEVVERTGLRVHCGHWLIQGRPRVLLLELGPLTGLLGELKHALRVEHGIDTTYPDALVDQAILFGEAGRRVPDAGT